MRNQLFRRRLDDSSSCRRAATTRPVDTHRVDRDVTGRARTDERRCSAGGWNLMIALSPVIQYSETPSVTGQRGYFNPVANGVPLDPPIAMALMSPLVPVPESDQYRFVPSVVTYAIVPVAICTDVPPPTGVLSSAPFPSVHQMKTNSPLATHSPSQ